MALRFTDGFDHYATADLSLKYSASRSTTIGSTYGRYGSSGALLEPGGYIQRTIDDQGTWIVGFAFKPMAYFSSAVALIRFYDSADAVQNTVSITSAGLIALYSGDQSTLLATSSVAPFTLGSWSFVECKTVISDTGSLEVKVDGTSIVSYSGDVQASATLSTAQKIRINQAGSGSANSYLDDLYILDGTGSLNNDFIGPMRIKTIYPSGAGTTKQFTGVGDTTNTYLNVAETPANEDTSYNYANTAGMIDSFVCSDIFPGTVYGVNSNLRARKDDSDTRTFAALTRSGGTDYAGTTQTLTSSYANYSQVWETNPNTSAAWTASEVNAAEFGYKVVA
jgi:hypothetical protein